MEYLKIINYKFKKNFLKKFFFFSQNSAYNFNILIFLHNVDKRKKFLFFSFLDDFVGQSPFRLINKSKLINILGVKSFKENIQIKLFNKLLINNFLLFFYINNFYFLRKLNCFVYNKQFNFFLYRKLFINIQSLVHIKLNLQFNTFIEKFIYINTIKYNLLK